MSKTEQLPAGSEARHVIQAWAHALFCSPLRPSQDGLTAQTVYAVVAEELARYMNVPGGCAGAVAQRAGDYPELFAERIAWCLKQATHAYTTPACEDCHAS
ncbi:hypothetical protein ACFYW6_38395 [Streptomyces sp. NPDC002659]|uniref:hypothetical protein n=1 Tax=Streptomyces sp. NPDC002659 TaxID=3364656 RepID=UPI0036C3B0BE